MLIHLRKTSALIFTHLRLDCSKYFAKKHKAQKLPVENENGDVMTTAMVVVVVVMLMVMLIIMMVVVVVMVMIMKGYKRIKHRK